MPNSFDVALERTMWVDYRPLRLQADLCLSDALQVNVHEHVSLRRPVSSLVRRICN